MAALGNKVLSARMRTTFRLMTLWTMVPVLKEALNTGEDSLAADGDKAQHYQGVVDQVFEGEGEIEDENEGAAAAAGRCSTHEQDDNAYSQLERDIFGGNSDLEDEQPKGKGRVAESFSQFASSSSGTVEHSAKGREMGPRERSCRGSDDGWN